MQKIKPLFYLFFLAIGCFTAVNAQELPILNQRLTKTFLYNPSLAGHDLGSVSFIHKKNWNDAAGSPVSNIISAHVPFVRGKVGVGINFISDKTNIYSTTYGSAAFAYRILFSEFSDLSFGLSWELSNAKIDPSLINVRDESDGVINHAIGNDETNNDYSFGLNFRSKYFGIGGGYNRLSSSFLFNKSESFLQDYFSGYFNLTLPIAQRRDFFEPMVTYRKLSSDKAQLDVGAYYTYNDLLLLGGSYGDNGVWNLQAGLQFSNFYLGYVYENFSGKTNKDLGGNNEIILRFDFSKAEGYKNKYASSTEKTKNAVAYRRKTLSKPPVGAKTPKKFNKKWKKKSKHAYSPNKRYDPKKLYTKKPKYGKKKYKPKRRKKRR